MCVLNLNNGSSRICLTESSKRQHLYEGAPSRATHFEKVSWIFQICQLGSFSISPFKATFVSSQFIKQMKDHRSDLLNLSSWESKPEKNSGLNGNRTHDTGSMYIRSTNPWISYIHFMPQFFVPSPVFFKVFFDLKGNLFLTKDDNLHGD